MSKNDLYEEDDLWDDVEYCDEEDEDEDEDEDESEEDFCEFCEEADCEGECNDSGWSDENIEDNSYDYDYDPDEYWYGEDD